MMTNKEQIVYREMLEQERVSVLRLGRQTFKGIEALFITKPKHAIVAVYEGEIIGAIIYTCFYSKKKKVAYLDDGFVSSAFQNNGIGKELYKQTFAFLWAQGCSNIVGLVKDDNIASWKLLIDNGFVRVSIRELLKQVHFRSFVALCVRTPFLIALGMDVYLHPHNAVVEEKKDGLSQLLIFFLCNFLIAAPLWLSTLFNHRDDIAYYIINNLIILTTFVFSRFIGTLFGKIKWQFRFNNGGGGLTFLLGFWGILFPMNGNWYPQKYNHTTSFKRDLALPEIIKFIMFAGLGLLALSDDSHLTTLAYMSFSYLLFQIVPIYPFDVLGGGRIFDYSKILWAMIVGIYVLEGILLYSIK